MATIEKLLDYVGDDMVLIGAIQELKQHREYQRLEIKSATKFLNNSQFKQLCHMTSELWEVWKAWIIFRIKPTHENRMKVASETVDLQSSSQTMLEGPLNLTNFGIICCLEDVIIKNKARGYYDQK